MLRWLSCLPKTTEHCQECTQRQYWRNQLNWQSRAHAPSSCSNCVPGHPEWMGTLQWSRWKDQTGTSRPGIPGDVRNRHVLCRAFRGSTGFALVLVSRHDGQWSLCCSVWHGLLLGRTCVLLLHLCFSGSGPLSVHRLAQCRGDCGQLVRQGQAGSDHGHLECQHLCWKHHWDRGLCRTAQLGLGLELRDPGSDHDGPGSGDVPVPGGAALRCRRQPPGGGRWKGLRGGPAGI
mmetsp:Transcript_4885/g.8482  ORF Transcript_4885/g.8482 Transcript_4885/m.8482 type:complete len:233 (-) Transcript_4885:1502-2200(-)